MRNLISSSVANPRFRFVDFRGVPYKLGTGFQVIHFSPKKPDQVRLYKDGLWISKPVEIDHPDWHTIATTAPPEAATDWLLEFGPAELRKGLEELLTYCGVGGGS